MKDAATHSLTKIGIFVRYSFTRCSSEPCEHASPQLPQLPSLWAQ